MATTKDENTFEMARKYAMCVVVVGGIPTMLQMTCAQLLRSVGVWYVWSRMGTDSRRYNDGYRITYMVL